ncbi:CvpA family protein [Patiriisocius sp. Uisw_047]|jgi:membrane protein required for colicin V production|uniref:CvpA family protein n=1 Tax=Patiriisocius sp. Uisw_047 TaxID=3230969 RepID=UPI0039EA4927
MNIVDIILGIILLFAFYKGAKQGLFVTLASLIGLVLGVIGAVYFSDYAADYLVENVSWSEQVINLVAFAITFLVIVFVIGLAGKALTKVADFAALGLVNKILGGIFNALKYGFIVSVIFMFINASSAVSGFIISEEKKEASMLYEPVASLAPLVLPHILEKVDELKPDKDKYDEDNDDKDNPPIQDGVMNEDL